MKKTNIRSIRFSDELAEQIDRQAGRNFTEKLENLVVRCVWELPAKETELARLESQVQEKRQQLQQLSSQLQTLRVTINALIPKVMDLEQAVERETQKWEL